MKTARFAAFVASMTLFLVVQMLLPSAALAQSSGPIFAFLEGDGAHRGHGTNVLAVSLRSLYTLADAGPSIDVASQLEPGAFGGRDALSEAQRDVVCSVQMMESEGNLAGGVGEWIADQIAADHGGDRAALLAALRNADLCKESMASRKKEVTLVASETQQAPSDISFPVDAKGIPVSSDPLWNACIRRHEVMDHDGLPYSCQRYHKGPSWRHPDLLIFFTWSDWAQPYLRVPPGYVVTPIGQDGGNANSQLLRHLE